MEKIPFTPQGLETIKTELAHLKNTERLAVINAISVAREHGDLSENAEYHAARERQSFIEGRISELEDVTSRADVIDAEKLTGERVTFGTSVGVADEETDEELVFHIVGPYEADTSRGLVSTSSPIARGLIGKRIGDPAEVHTPGGTRSDEIISIDPFAMDRVIACAPAYSTPSMGTPGSNFAERMASAVLTWLTFSAGVSLLVRKR